MGNGKQNTRGNRSLERQLKHGRYSGLIYLCIYTCIYTSHTMCIKPPHVIVFSNDEPKLQNDKGNLTLSADRWNIVDIANFSLPQQDTYNHGCIPSSTRKRVAPAEHSCNSTFCKICVDIRRKRIKECKNSTNGSMIPLSSFTITHPVPLDDNAPPFRFVP